MWLAPCSLAAVWLAATSGSAQRILSLDGSWRLSSDAGHALVGSVPGDLISDLERARLVQDPLYELGFISNNIFRVRLFCLRVFGFII